jgi:hypothetical protein
MRPIEVILSRRSSLIIASPIASTSNRSLVLAIPAEEDEMVRPIA